MNRHPNRAARARISLAGLADSRARPSYLPRDGLGFALSHRMDSEGWILAQATEASHLGSARLVGSDCLTTESTGAASVAGNHRDKAAIAGGFRQRHAGVLSLSSGGNKQPAWG